VRRRGKVSRDGIRCQRRRGLLVHYSCGTATELPVPRRHGVHRRRNDDARVRDVTRPREQTPNEFSSYHFDTDTRRGRILPTRGVGSRVVVRV